ncbi:MAG: BACON domain-containing carbohydrate-binding protein [Dysgonamonadaceae bacterium]|nr:BACON domain-containing carbohydrate-binding protein [Dysgonamonadaceae bacterium]MDD3309537.1 BACON domain-containing carbohydrate-binding protein [Dysgonamonadaceae bacterium]MDD3900915.1 BACON domain-containing carbohydrate-binding protein [Dysgonamonadaceae bacterium]MDD4399550.1 BACON domain-containing carbohydrate-binding protein [Dysgonamonadaceae bacterium]
MKLFKQKVFIFSFYLCSLLSILFLMNSCDDNDGSMKWVDLRYRVEDSYLLEAENPELITFQVKSTDPWEVFGNADWYTISPRNGEAGETYTVTITCEDNIALDDRIDTINIKSDYWIGKQFVLTQKGTAFLEVDWAGMINQEGDQATFNVHSNQNWSAEVTEGDIWLSILEGTSGQQDGKITMKVSRNTGEQRTGIITIYDRNRKPVLEVECTQDGVLLLPATPENGKWFAIYEQEQQLVIPVETNVEWSVSKENEEDDDWYDFEKTTFNGTDKLIINVSKHIGSTVRTGVILLQTKAEEGTTPVVKSIKFKQANPQIPDVKNVNSIISGNFYGPNGLMPGIYNFYLDPFGAAQFELFFIWSQSKPYAELRYHILNKKTRLSTTPWCGDVFNENGKTTHDVNTDQSNVLSLNIKEAVDPIDSSKSWIYTEWLLNGNVIAKATSDGIKDADGSSDTWKVPFSEISAGATFLLRSSGGGIGLKKWEYIAPLNWGD